MTIGEKAELEQVRAEKREWILAVILQGRSRGGIREHQARDPTRLDSARSVQTVTRVARHPRTLRKSKPLSGSAVDLTFDSRKAFREERVPHDDRCTNEHEQGAHDYHIKAIPSHHICPYSCYQPGGFRGSSIHAGWPD